jgi:hypothetical protein
MDLAKAAPLSLAFLIMGTQTAYQPIMGGTLVPAAQFWFGLPTDAAGATTFGWPATPGLQSGFVFYGQYWVLDAGASFSLSASNAIAATIP